jgi:hypothetical protein
MVLLQQDVLVHQTLFGLHENLAESQLAPPSVFLSLGTHRRMVTSVSVAGQRFWTSPAPARHDGTLIPLQIRS